MKITQEVRDYAEAQGISEDEAIDLGMQAQAQQFVEKGAEVYL
jgi:phosphomethylpyrimidine synthase